MLKWICELDYRKNEVEALLEHFILSDKVRELLDPNYKPFFIRVYYYIAHIKLCFSCSHSCNHHAVDVVIMITSMNKFMVEKEPPIVN